jgi:hypothetical protein
MIIELIRNEIMASFPIRNNVVEGGKYELHCSSEFKRALINNLIEFSKKNIVIKANPENEIKDVENLVLPVIGHIHFTVDMKQGYRIEEIPQEVFKQEVYTDLERK